MRDDNDTRNLPEDTSIGEPTDLAHRTGTGLPATRRELARVSGDMLDHLDKIRIEGLEVFANHGVYPAENELGQKFADGVKKGDTDLDVFLRKNGRNFAIESKAYSGVVPDTMVKADAESLITFCRTIGGTTPVFCFETPPSGFTRHFLAEKGVKCLVGTPEEIMAKLDVLSNIMGR